MPSTLATASATGAMPQDLHRALREALQTAPGIDDSGGFPRDWWAHLGRGGMLGLGFSADGRPPVADAVQVSALAGQITHATGSLGLGMAWMMQQMLGRYVLGPLLQQGASGTLSASHALLTQLLASMAAGECLLALAISEPGVGAQPKHLRTRAVLDRDGEHWILDGHKAFVSNGPAADAIIVLAVSSEHEGRKRFDAFLLDTQTPGLAREANAGVQGLAPLGHCDLLLASCRASASRRIGAPGQAFETIARPVRAVEDALLLGPLLGAMQCELQALARALGMAAATSGDNSVSNTAATDAVRELGALQLEWQALHAVRDAVARQLETQGYEEALAYSTVGARRLLERWQTAYERACEGASQAVSLAPLFAENSAQTGVAPRSLARDLRLVLGIARGVAQSRQRQTGQQLLHSISS